MPEQEDSASLHERLERMERRLEELAQRVERIEQRIEPARPQETPSAPAEPPPEEMISAQPVIPPPPVIPPLSEEALTRLALAAEQTPPSEPAPPVTPLTTEADTGISSYWEQMVGGKGALWLGSIAIFFALAFFLAYAWQLLGDWARLMVGFLAGAVLLAFGEGSRQRVERWFSEGISGAGVAILYLSIWAGSQRYHLFSTELSFVLMAVTVLLGVLLALRYDAISLSLLATTGGFLTPVLLQGEGGTSSTPYPLFTYVTVLNAGILAVSLYRQWRALVWLSFVASVLLLLGWAEGNYTERFRWVVFSYVTANFLLFLGCACFRSLVQGAITGAGDLLVVFADAGVYALAGYALIGDALGRYSATFALALAVLFGLLSGAVRGSAPQNHTLRDSLAGIALFFVTIAIPMQLKQDLLVVGWAAQSAMLIALGTRLNSTLLYRAGQIVWGITLVALTVVLTTVEPERHLLFLNERGLPLLATVIATAVVGIYARQTTLLKDEFAPVYQAVATLGGAGTLAHETALLVSWQSARLGAAWQAVAVYAVATVLAVYALPIYLLGARVNEVWVRFCALLVATLSAVLPVWAAMAMPADSWTPFWNARWLSVLMVSALLGALAWAVSRESARATREEGEALGLLAVLVCLLVLIGLSAEVYFGFRAWQIPEPQGWAVAVWFSLVALWSVFAAMFVTLGLIWDMLALRVLGYVVGGVALSTLAGHALFTLPGTDASVAWVPLFNLRALAFVVSTLAVIWVAGMLARYRSHNTPSETSLAGSLVALGAAVLLWGITQETYEAFYYWHVKGALGDNWQSLAQMAISLVWTLFAGVTLVLGVVRSVQAVRLAALGLLGLTALKVFLFDLSFLDTPMRVLSFGGLGLTLIGISWLYSRYGVGKVKV